MSKKLMLIAAAIFGFNVCAMAQAPAPKADEKPAMEKPADAKAEKKAKKAAKKGKKAKGEKKDMSAAPAAPVK